MSSVLANTVGLHHVVDFAAASRPNSTDLLSVDRETVHPDRSVLGGFLRDCTTLQAIRDCGRYGRRRCDVWLCARCGPRRQRANATHARQVVANAGTVLLWTATVEGAPGRPLAAVWDDLDQAWQAVARHGWLTARLDGYARHTGVNFGTSGWHPHLHSVLTISRKISRSEAVDLAADIRTRWVGTTSRLGIVAHPLGQAVQHPRTPVQAARAATYAASQAWGHPNGLDGTPEGVLRAAAAGAADALDLWHELEAASRARRLRAVGGSFRQDSRLSA